MKPLELAADAARSMVGPGTPGLILTVPKGALPHRFPRGELLNEMKRNGVVERTYRFDPSRIIAWLVGNGLVKMTRRDDNTLVFTEPVTHGSTS